MLFSPETPVFFVPAKILVGQKPFISKAYLCSQKMTAPGDFVELVVEIFHQYRV